MKELTYRSDINMLEKYEQLRELLLIQLEEITYKLDCVDKKESILDTESRIYMNHLMDLIMNLNAKLNNIDRKMRELQS